MAIKLPNGYWCKSETVDYYCIGFQYGGHAGGECEIFVSKSQINSFLNDLDWRQQVVNKFSRVIFIGNPDSPMPISETMKQRDGYIPDGWKVPLSHNLPLGYWIIQENNTNTHLCIARRKKTDGGFINFQIYLPREKLKQFCEDDEWRNSIVQEFAKVYFTGEDKNKPDIPQELTLRTGYV